MAKCPFGVCAHLHTHGSTVPNRASWWNLIWQAGYRGPGCHRDRVPSGWGCVGTVSKSVSRSYLGFVLHEVVVIPRSECFE